MRWSVSSDERLHGRYSAGPRFPSSIRALRQGGGGLEGLGGAFGDCLINDADEIDEDFLCYPVGTDRFDIWHDIEDDLGVSIYKLMTEDRPRTSRAESLDEMMSAKREEAEFGDSGHDGMPAQNGVDR